MVVLGFGRDIEGGSLRPDILGTRHEISNDGFLHLCSGPFSACHTFVAVAIYCHVPILDALPWVHSLGELPSFLHQKVCWLQHELGQSLP